MIERLCRGCRVHKTDSGFYSTGGVPSEVCRSCELGETRQRQKLIPSSQKQKSRAKHLRKNYGITTDQVVRMLERQGGKCAICGVTMAAPGSAPTSMVVDRCHASSKVRALLCNHCNRAIGFARDNPDVLRAAARYVEEHQEADRVRLESLR